MDRLRSASVSLLKWHCEHNSAPQTATFRSWSQRGTHIGILCACEICSTTLVVVVVVCVCVRTFVCACVCVCVEVGKPLQKYLLTLLWIQTQLHSSAAPHPLILWQIPVNWGCISWWYLCQRNNQINFNSCGTCVISSHNITGLQQYCRMQTLIGYSHGCAWTDDLKECILLMYWTPLGMHPIKHFACCGFTRKGCTSSHIFLSAFTTSNAEWSMTCGEKTSYTHAWHEKFTYFKATSLLSRCLHP